MTEKEIKHENYNCSQTGSIVKITRNILIQHCSATQAIEAKHTTAIACDHNSSCGVRDSSGSCDWKRCIHPDLKE